MQKEQTPIDAESSGGPSIHCSHTDLMPIADLKPNPRNPNRHPDSQISLLARVISEQGWRAPITVSTRSGYVVRGHGRLMAAKKLGLKYAPVDSQSYSSDAEEMADLVADNRLAELSGMDAKTVRDIIDEISFEMPIESTGYDHDGLSELIGKIDEIYAVQPDHEDDKKGKMSTTKPIYQIDEVLTTPPAKMVWGLIGVPADRWIDIAESFEQWGTVEEYSVHISPTGEKNDGVY